MKSFVPFEISAEKTLINHQYCTVRQQSVVFPDQSSGEWFILGKDQQAAVIIVPLLADGRIGWQQTYKHGARTTLWEFPAGLRDPGETSLTAAQRELEEETGGQATDWQFLGSALANPTSSSLEYHFFLARGVEFVKEPNLEPAEQIAVCPLSIAETKKRLQQLDQFLVSSGSLSAWALALPYLKDS